MTIGIFGSYVSPILGTFEIDDLLFLKARECSYTRENLIEHAKHIVDSHIWCSDATVGSHQELNSTDKCEDKIGIPAGSP